MEVKTMSKYKVWIHVEAEPEPDKFIDEIIPVLVGEYESSDEAVAVAFQLVDRS
jgi:hypothetical protein